MLSLGCPSSCRVVRGRKRGVGTAFIASASPHHSACHHSNRRCSTMGDDRAWRVLGFGGRDECGPYRGSLVLPPCKKMTDTLESHKIVLPSPSSVNLKGDGSTIL